MTMGECNRVELEDGAAELMGDGVVVLCQKEERGVAQNVVVTRADLERLLAAC